MVSIDCYMIGIPEITCSTSYNLYNIPDTRYLSETSMLRYEVKYDNHELLHLTVHIITHMSLK